MPLGVSTVSAQTDHLLLNLDFTINNTHTIVATADDTYIKSDNLLCGCSTTWTAIKIYSVKAGTSNYVDPSTLSSASGNINVFGLFS